MTEHVGSESSQEVLIQVEDLFDREIRPLLASHLGGANITGIDDNGTVEIEFTGACTSCAFRRNTIVGAIYPRLRDVEGVNAVSTPGVAVPVAQQHRLAAVFDHYAARGTAGHEKTPSQHACQRAC
ncbi:NifU family protein [Nocardioides sp. AN3]